MIHQHPRRAIGALLCTALLLSACGDDKSPAPQAKAQPAAPAATKVAEPAVAENPREVNADSKFRLGAPGPAPSFDQYLEITTGNQLAFMYNKQAEQMDSIEFIAKSINIEQAEPDLQPLLKQLEEAENAGNPFTKSDAVEAIQPFIQQQILAAPEDRYVKMFFTAQEMEFQPYDFERKGFEIQNRLFRPELENAKRKATVGWDAYSKMPPEKAYITFSDNRVYSLGFENGPTANFLKVEDEATARRLQDAFLANDHGIWLYGLITATQDNTNPDNPNTPRRALLVDLQALDVVEGAEPAPASATLFSGEL